MNPSLRLQIAIGVIANDVERGGTHPGTFVPKLIHQFNFVTLGFRPAGVHADQHLCPVARLGTTSTGLNTNVRVGCVLRTTKHATQLECFEKRNHLGGFCRKFGFKRRFFSAQFLKGFQIVESPLNLLVSLEHFTDGLVGADLFLGLFRVVPERGFRLQGIELKTLLALGADVKESLVKRSSG